MGRHDTKVTVDFRLGHYPKNGVGFAVPFSTPATVPRIGWYRKEGLRAVLS